MPPILTPGTENALKYPTCGWGSDFETLRDAAPVVVRKSLEEFVKEYSPEQISAWDDEISLVRDGADTAIQTNAASKKYTAILEYQLPLEFRRPDVIFLPNGAVVVLEFKSKSRPELADLDQVMAYARDLRCYHRECADQPVYPVLLLTRYKGPVRIIDGVSIAGPREIANLVATFSKPAAIAITPEAFLREDAYAPLPSLVKAARALFQSGNLPKIWRARATTDHAIEQLSRIAQAAASGKHRCLALLTGVPGSGKTLVGLRLVHSDLLDDLAVSRASGKPSVPGVFLSGNGPLVQVLQYELKSAGGAGKTFVRDVKGYVSMYSKKGASVPPEHVLVFDEAQRAWSAEKVRAKHGDPNMRSEPEHFVEFAERIPEWCMILGLIGGGQEIHEGEEGGLVQWRKAVEEAGDPMSWRVFGSSAVEAIFAGSKVSFERCDALNLDTEVRYHLTPEIHSYVDGLIGTKDEATLCSIASRLQAHGYRLLITRDLDLAKKYVRNRYQSDPSARFGLLASAKDKTLVDFGVLNGFMNSINRRVGPWFAEGDGHADSCRHLKSVATEFDAQGLELDFAVVCWGTDYFWTGTNWSNARARGYKRGVKVVDPLQLRKNAYRVLLTRGRDGAVLFVPPTQDLDKTYSRLVQSGFVEVDGWEERFVA